MPISALPAVPNRGSAPATFSADTDSFLGALPTFRTEANALATEVNDYATSASASASAAENSATSAANSATQAAASAVTAAINAPAWVSGNSYALGAVVYSPIDFKTYRRIVAGAGTTDPSLDTTNWRNVVIAKEVEVVSPLRVTASGTVTFGSTVGTGTNSHGVQVINLDATYDLMIVGGNSSLHAVAFNKTTSTFGTPALIRTANVNIQLGLTVSAKIDGTRVLVASVASGAATLEVVVVTNTAGTLSVGTAATATLSGNITNDTLDLIAVGSSFVLGYRVGTPNSELRGISISGTTVTLSAASTLTGTTYVRSLIALSSSAFLAISQTPATSITFSPFTISGSTLTAGTVATSTAITTGDVWATRLLSTGRVGVIGRATSANNNNTLGFVVGVAANVATATVATLLTGTSANRGCVLLLSDKIIVASDDASAAYGIGSLVDVSGTATAGTAITATGLAVSPSMQSNGYNGSELWVSHQTFANTQWVQLRIGLSGNNPVINSRSAYQIATTVQGLPNHGAFATPTASIGSAGMQTGTGYSAAIGTAAAVQIIATAGSPIVISYSPQWVTQSSWSNPPARYSDSTVWTCGNLNNSTQFMFHRCEFII